MNADTLTTGQVAKLCSVSSNTVIKWLESGLLKGYVLPGSLHHRIPRKNLVAFMEKAGMPTEELK